MNATGETLSSTVLGVHIATVFVYLMLGLRLYPGIACALPLTAVLICARRSRRPRICRTIPRSS